MEARRDERELDLRTRSRLMLIAAERAKLPEGGALPQPQRLPPGT